MAINEAPRGKRFGGPTKTATDGGTTKKKAAKKKKKTTAKKAIAPAADDYFADAQERIDADGGRSVMQGLKGSELMELLKAAKKLAGAALIEPEHLTLAIIKERDLPLEPADEAKLKKLAEDNAGGDGMGATSARSMQVIAKAEAATVEALAQAIGNSPLEAASIYSASVRQAAREEELGTREAKGTGDKKLPKIEGKFLTQLGDDLVQMAKDDQIDLAVGRNKEVEYVFRQLGKRNLASICLTGDRGVGKTAIAEGLANQISDGKVPQQFENARILRMPAGRITAACNCPANGGPQGVIDRLTAEIAAAKQKDPPMEVILFVDEIHTLVGPDAGEVAQHLKAALARGKIKIVGASTTGEYNASIRDDPALADRIGSYEIEEPNDTNATQMVLANLNKYEAFHAVEIDASAADAAVRFAKYSGMKKPRGPVDWVDEASSAVKQQLGERPPALRRLRNEIAQVNLSLEQAEGDDVDSNRVREKLAEKRDGLTEQFDKLTADAKIEKAILEQLQGFGSELSDELDKEFEIGDDGSTSGGPEQAKVDVLKGKIEDTRKELRRLPQRLYHLRVDAYAVAQAVSDKTGMELEKLQESGSAKFTKVEQTLSEKVIGQDHAKKSLSKQIRRWKTGFRDPDSPIGVHFFAGTTGTGKTELAKAVADEFFGGSLIRFDCNEMMREHELARLMGSPPGYVGFEGGSQLAEEIRKANGHAVLLLDEIEKAHPNIFPLLMQLMDEGRLRDNEGNEVDCTNVQIIMTSNLGDSVFADHASRGEDGQYADKEQMIAQFSEIFSQRIPEAVRNRLTKSSTGHRFDIFDPLSEKVMPKIFNIKFGKLAERVKEQSSIELTVSDAARKYVCKAGYEPAFGARPLNQAIADLIEDPLSDAVLGGKISEGDKIEVGMKGGQLVLNKKK